MCYKKTTIYQKRVLRNHEKWTIIMSPWLALFGIQNRTNNVDIMHTEMWLVLFVTSIYLLIVIGLVILAIYRDFYTAQWLRWSLCAANRKQIARWVSRQQQSGSDVTFHLCQTKTTVLSLLCNHWYFLHKTLCPFSTSTFILQWIWL